MSIRAVRDNNPGNIRIGTNWQGLALPSAETAEQQAEHDFCVFKTPAWGFRAMATILLNYHRLHNRTTLRQYISAWAPPSENDTGAYVADVSRDCGAGPDAGYDLTVPVNLVKLCRAISKHEAGGWLFNDSDLAQGVAMAEGQAMV